MGTDDVIARHNGRDRAAVIGLRDEIGAVRHLQLIGMHEIGVEAVRAERQAFHERVVAGKFERVPPHVRDF